LQLALTVKGRRIVAEFDVRTCTAALTISHPAERVGKNAEVPATTPTQAAAPLLWLEDEPIAVPVASGPETGEPVPADEPVLAEPSVAREPATEPSPAQREASQTSASPVYAGRAEREDREATVPGPRWRPLVGFVVIILASAGLAMLGLVAASRLAATDSSDRALMPPPPTQTVDELQGTGTAASRKPPARSVGPKTAQEPTARATHAATKAVVPPSNGETSGRRAPPPAGTLGTPVVVRWARSPNAVVYWFELYRRGRLGARKVLEAWPAKPQFRIPVRVPGGTWLRPGHYDWSASPQTTRRGRVHYTAVGEAGRFVIRPDGQVVLQPR
jgi:hypothetical protein